MSAFGDGLRAVFRPDYSRGGTTKGSTNLEAAALLDDNVPPSILSPWSTSDDLNKVVWSDLFGTDADLILTRAEAMSVPAVARARNVLASTLGRLPLIVTDRAGAEVAANCLRQPDPAQSRFSTITWTVDDLIFYGYSWWLILGRLAGDNRPASFRRIHPGGVELDDGGRVKVYGRPTPAADVVRIDGPHEGILNYAGRSLRSAVKLERSAARFAANPVPAVELHQTDDYPLTDTERDALVAKWALARAGDNGGVAYTSRSIEARIHGLPAEHLLTAGRNTAAIDAARVVGVPADVVDASPEKASMTYANAETRARILVDYGLGAYAAALVGRLSMDDILPAGTGVAFAGLVLDRLDTDPAPGAPPAPTPTEGNP